MFTQFKQLALAGSMVLLAGWDASAQQQLAQQHTNRYSLLQPFVSEGVLVDRSPLSLLRSTRGLDPDKYSYLRQDTTTFSDFVSYYRLWQGASYQASRFPLLPDLLFEEAQRQEYGNTFASTWQQRSVQTEVVLAGMRFNYREIAEDALDSMYVYYDENVDKYRLGLGTLAFTDTVFTNPNDLSQYSIQSFSRTFNNAITLQRWAVTRSFFMLAAHTNTVVVEAGQPVRFALPSALFFGNLNGLQLQLDLDDGMGFRNFHPGQIVQTIYAVQGPKFIKYRLINSDNGSVTLQNGVIALRVGQLRLGPPTTVIESSTTSCIQFPGVAAGYGAAFVRTAPQNQGRIVKPFVLVEGFEGSDIVKASPKLVNADAKGFGDLNWYSISSGEYGPGNEHMAELTTFLDSVNRAGYDIVFVDFITNRDRIEANAMALASILLQINQQLASNGSTANIELVGASMGGLISRVALRQMELSGCCHNVKLFTTYATPHQGANIPLGIQHSLKDVGYRSNAFGLLDDHKDRYDHILNSPAARQMLVYHVETSAKVEREGFVQLLQELGLPQEPRKSAVTNGSITGLLQKTSDELNAPFIQPSMQLLLASAEIWVPNRFPLPHNEKSYRSAGTDGMYFLRSEGFVLPHSPTVPSNALIYKAGQGAWANFADIAGSYLTYSTSMFKLGKMAFATIAAAAATPPIAPAIIAAGAIKATAFSLGVNQSLVNQLNSNVADNQSHLIVTADFPSLGLDYAPGDFQETNQQIGKSALLTKRQSLSRFSFVSTASSLELPDLNLFVPLHLSAFKDKSNSFSHFEAFYMTSDGGSFNSIHVDVNFVVSSQIQTNQVATISSIVSQPSVQGNLNIGRPLFVSQTSWLMNADVELAPWRVSSGGLLGINRNQPVNVTGQPLLPTNLPSPNFHFITKTSTFDCDSVPVVIENGGAMELGEIQPGNALTAEVYFRQASSLTLHSGSELRINNRSRLIIEQGSTLIVHPGANIVLDGDSAILEIRGSVVLVNNALFSFSGTGFVRLNQSPQLSASNWTFGAGSGIKLEGASITDKVLEVVGECVIMDTSAFLEVRNARVELVNTGRLNVHTKVIFENTHVTGTGIKQHQGVLVHGQPQIDISNSQFTNGNVGLVAYLLTYNGGIALENVVFENNNVGFESHGRFANLSNCTGRSNSIFWRGYDIEGVSRVRDCQITQNNEGIHVMGQHGAQLEILDSRIDSNFRGVVSFGDLKLKPYCTSISYNQEGIYAGNTHVLMGGNVNNRLNGNYIAIKLEEVDNLFIKNGYNDFSGSDWYITGSFTGIANQYLIQIPNVHGYFLDVANNKMPLIQQQLPIDLEDGDGNRVYGTHWTFVGSLPIACARIATADFDYWVLSNSDVTQPVVFQGASMALPNALLEAVQLVTKEDGLINPRDLEAVQKFHEIFDYLRVNAYIPINPKEQLLMDLALTRMIEAVSNAYRYALLEAARANEEFPISEIISWTAQEIEHRIWYAESNLDLGKVNKLRLKLAHLYRIGEYYDNAIQQLYEVINAGTGFNEDYFEASYWKCVCEVEQKWIRNEIKAYEFELMRRPCFQLLPENRRTRPALSMQPVYDANAKPALVLSVFPNPASTVVNITQHADNGDAQVRVINMQGQVVLEDKWENPYEQFTLEVGALVEGLYFVEVKTSNGKQGSTKIVKQ